jgi:cobalt-zinc-cadmium efflux system membrane fusion protein
MKRSKAASVRQVRQVRRVRQATGTRLRLVNLFGLCLFFALAIAALSVEAQQTAPAPVTITIAPDLLAKGGIETAPATRGRSTAGLRVPATVQPNAYRQVTVVSTAGGRVTSVPVQLGQHVRANDVVATVHSPDVADAERAYVARQAELVAARQQVTRLERLVTIGAASQQELDAARAQQTGLAAELESGKARLMLLGRTQAQVASLTGAAAIAPEISYVAPLDGTVTTRAANPGQTIEAGTPIVTVVDLSTVWVVGEVYERDLAAARVGAAVTITSAALPGEAISGSVAYVDPQIAPDSRTARVRVEVPNKGGRLLLGMLMEMRLDSAAGEAILVPRQAIQTIGDVPVVYIADPARPGTFVEHSVRVGATRTDVVEILSGVATGDRVVTSGSFLVRSERDRTNAGSPRPVPARTPSTTASAASTVEQPRPRIIDVAITKDGFVPAEIAITAGEPVRLRFTRQVEKTCATEVVFPSLKIQKALPLGQAVVVDLPSTLIGRVAFSCGMNMYKGQVVVR